VKLLQRPWLPAGLAGRFALASAGLAAVGLLLVSLASWWLIDRQHDEAEAQLAARAREFHAANIASTLSALHTRMAEVAGSTILATGLVDSAGKETYLTPFLNGIRQVNGIPLRVLFTDYEGKEIAGNNTGAQFGPPELEWLRGQLAAGQAAARIFNAPGGPELLAFEPLRYARTSTPEGALLYKISLNDINLEPGLRLEWGPAAGAAARVTPVAVPAVFQPLGFRLMGTPLAAAANHARIGPQYLMIGVLALVIFAALFLAGARLARLLTRDLSRLQAFSSQVVSADVGEQRAPEIGSAEVASLARSINRMLERLREQHEALRQEGGKLAALAEQLQTADRRKDEFLAMLAHELRNPLAPIATGAELLRQLPEAGEPVRRTSDIIARQVRHMTKIVDDLLDVSRVTRGLVVIERQPVDVAAVVAAAADQIRPFAQARHQRLETRLPATPLAVTGDAARLVQVVSNLLHNGCKYTPDGGHVVLDARAEDGEVVLRVSDNGSGIAPEFLPDVFGLFVQGSRSPDRSQGGLGLGLPLVRQLVELHGGRVRADSPGLGQGTTVTVRLPRLEMPDAAALPALPAIAAAEPEPVPVPVPAPIPAPAVANTPAPAPGGGLRLLVVDDNVDAAETLAALLEMDGHAVSVAYDGPSALERAVAEQPEVMILDIGLPGMDGIELARRLRAVPELQGAVLMALTGYGQQADRARSAEAGFDHHLVKPADPQQIGELLAQLQRERA
jgi:signal transduction histidine kinase